MMRATTVGVALLCTAVVSSSAHAQKAASELAELCVSTTSAERARCLGYIQGYLEGANNATAEAGLVDQADSESAWFRRAIDTRLGAREARLGARPQDLAQDSQSYCLSGDNPAAQVKARIRAESAGDEDAAAAWLHTLSQREFPC